jgi:hypothetical protein
MMDIIKSFEKLSFQTENSIEYEISLDSPIKQNIINIFSSIGTSQVLDVSQLEAVKLFKPT